MIRTTRLPNGARIVTEVVDEVYSASIGIFVDVGSEDESEATNGVSHCLEHMLFKGTTSRSAEQISQEIEDVGGSLGAATSKENTCFYGRVMGEELPVAIDLLLDMLCNATLTEEDLDLERQVILEEIRMYEDDPEDLAHELLLLNVWPGHPLSRPITGTYESVKALTSEMLKRHVADYYSPANIVVSIAGKFDEQKAIDLLSEGLSQLNPGRPKPALTVPQMRPFQKIKDKDVEQAQVVVSTGGMRITDDRRYDLAVFDLCLGGNMSSRLFQEVREKRGLVYTINSFKTSHKLTGLFGVYAGCGPSKVGPVLELVMKEFTRVKAEGFTAAEIKRAKTQLKSDLLLGFESMRSRTTRNAYGELFFDRQLEVEEILGDIERVTEDGIIRLANELLVAQDMSLMVVGPAKQLEKSYVLSC